MKSSTRSMRIALRADGGPRVGLGHLGRCAALAQAFRARGARPVFVEVPSSCAKWVRGRGFPLGRLSDGPWDLLVADSYRFKTNDWRLMRKAAKTVLAVEDRSRRPAGADWVLNGHAYARPSRGGGLLAGARYMPLRREYWRPSSARAARSVVLNFLVTLGGGDGWGLAAQAAALAAKMLPAARVHLVVGPLAAIPRSLPARVHLHRAPASLKPLLQRCDAGLCAGGQTLYEFAATGTPAVVVELGPDQRANIRSIARAGAAVPVGRPGPAWNARFTRALAALTPARRRAMSAAGRALVDGRGALRAADALLEAAA